MHACWVMWMHISWQCGGIACVGKAYMHEQSGRMTGAKLWVLTCMVDKVVFVYLSLRTHVYIMGTHTCVEMGESCVYQAVCL